MSTDDTVVMLRPRQRREAAMTTLDEAIGKLVASSRLQGELELMARLHKMGVPMVLDNSVGMEEFLLALGTRHLTMTTVEDGVQVIHRSRE